MSLLTQIPNPLPKIKVSENDLTLKYLNGGLVEGAGISLTELNDGGNETLAVANTDTGSSAVSTHLLASDPHTQYAILTGRASGQILKGGIASGENLTLQSTTHATKGKIYFGLSSFFDEASSYLDLINASSKAFRISHTPGSIYVDFKVNNKNDLTCFLPITGFNICIGSGFPSVTAGSSNIAFGENALLGIKNGSANFALGSGALRRLESGIYNTAVGVAVLGYNVNGNRNTGVGTLSLFYSTGNDNTCIGYEAGDNITSGSFNVIIGSGVDALVANGSYQLNIGNALLGDLNTGDLWVKNDNDKFFWGGGKDFSAYYDGSNAYLKTDEVAASDLKLVTGADKSLILENGLLALKEVTTPTAVADYGRIYTKSDNKLYFQDGAGTEHEIQFV